MVAAVSVGRRSTARRTSPAAPLDAPNRPGPHDASEDSGEGPTALRAQGGSGPSAQGRMSALGGPCSAQDGVGRLRDVRPARAGHYLANAVFDGMAAPESRSPSGAPCAELIHRLARPRISS